ADVDHLDRLGVDHALAPCHGGEGIEVDADEVERLDVLVVERIHVLRDVAAREDAGMDARVQRLDAAAEHLRRRGDRLDARDRDLVLFELRRGPARRDDLPSELDEAARERLDVLLVIDRDQCARRGHEATIISRTTVGSSRCSTAWIRSSSVSRGSSGSCSWRRIGPVSRPSSTRWIVTPVVLTFALSASSIACMPGNAGNKDGWTLTIRPGNRSRNGFVRRCM